MIPLSLRTRVALATLPLLAAALVAVVTAVTLLYAAILDRNLRHSLRGAAATMAVTWPDRDPKQLVSTLARQGIATDILTGPRVLQGDRPANRPTDGVITSAPGSLLVLHQVLSDGTTVSYSASTKQGERSVRQLLGIETVVSLVVLLVAVVLLGRTTRTALRPLAEVAATARRIADGQRARRLNPVRTDTELGAMAAAFDAMVDALEHAVAQSARAESGMRMFLAEASHELRTPVAALQATVETLLREQPRRPRRDVIEASLAREALRLGRLVEELLDLARVEGVGDFEPVDLAVVANRVVADARRGESQVQISCKASEAATVSGDAAALERTVRNLVDNAVRVAPRTHGVVVVAVQRAPGQVKVTVNDNGPGIPELERERIFDPFVRLSETVPGHGLGLTIARRIARLHGGDLVCNQPSDGAGFTLHLPAATPDPEARDLSATGPRA